MSDPTRALRLLGIEQRFPIYLGLRHRVVLAGIDLELDRGRTLALAGANGSGKSTLLRLLAGIDRASAGTLEVLGGSPCRSAIRRRIGYLPEESPFPPELSARACLHLLGSLQGLRRRELAVESARLLDVVGLRDEARTRLARYSRGMLRRFGLAQAWLSRPELLLLDEPTAGLDAQGFEVFERLLAEATARGATVVFASHVIADVMERCDELAVLVEGRIVARGAPHAVLRDRSLLDLYRDARARGPASARS